jgi:hypothetical protein
MEAELKKADEIKVYSSRTLDLSVANASEIQAGIADAKATP